MADGRSAINLVSFFVTCAVLFVSFHISNGGQSAKKGRERALLEFTDITDNATYVSETTFDSGGMEPLYDFTNAFMDMILTKDIYPEGFLKIEDNQLVFGSIDDEWRGLLGKYGGLVAMIVIILLLLLAVPISGLCFCCCRCCGNCGATPHPTANKHRICETILEISLVVLVALLLSAAVCTLVGAGQMKQGVDELPKNLKNSIKDVNSYLRTTTGQVNTLLNVNYEEFETVLLQNMDDSTNLIYGEFTDLTTAMTSMTELADIVGNLPDVLTGYNKLKTSTADLRDKALELNDAMREVKNELLDTLNLCSMPQCDTFKNEVNQLPTDINFNNLPDISLQIGVLEALRPDDLKNAVTEGEAKLTDISTTIANTLAEGLDEARSQIAEVKTKIREGSEKVLDVVSDLQDQIENKTKPTLDDFENYIQDYSIYMYDVGIVLSCILLLVGVCVVIGVMLGMCGRQSRFCGNDCYSRGSQALIAGVVFMFFFTFFLAALVLVAFIVGMVSQRIVCDPIRDPLNSGVFKLFDQMNFSDYHIDNFKMSEMLADCYENKSIYNVFRLEKEFNLTEVSTYIEKYHLSDIMDDLLETIQGAIDFDNVEILSETDETMLRALADSAANFVNVDFEIFENLFDENLATLDLEELLRQLGQLIDEIGDALPAVTSALTATQTKIEGYRDNIVTPMTSTATETVELAQTLEEQVGGGTFQNAVKNLFNAVTAAETSLNEEGQNKIIQIFTDFTGSVLDQIQTYLDRVVVLTQTDVGQCGPVNTLIHGVLTSTCDKILLPWNGSWFELFWSLILFIPMIIISVKLGTLYKELSSPLNLNLTKNELVYKRYKEYPDASESEDDKYAASSAPRYENYSEPQDSIYAPYSHLQDPRYAAPSYYSRDSGNLPYSTQPYGITPRKSSVNTGSTYF